jgi:hypothetical protein
MLATAGAYQGIPSIAAARRAVDQPDGMMYGPAHSSPSSMDYTWWNKQVVKVLTDQRLPQGLCSRRVSISANGKLFFNGSFVNAQTGLVPVELRQPSAPGIPRKPPHNGFRNSQFQHLPVTSILAFPRAVGSGERHAMSVLNTNADARLMPVGLGSGPSGCPDRPLDCPHPGAIPSRSRHTSPHCHIRGDIMPLPRPRQKRRRLTWPRAAARGRRRSASGSRLASARR